ncbi:MAG: 50S ribosomal protein L18 [bacterium]|nr:50S ribosomal protein L18 [bacterium]
MKRTIVSDNRTRRRARIRAKVKGTEKMPRLSVFRSNRYLYGQLIDDEKGKTLAAASDANVKAKTKVLRAKEAGKLLGKAALAKKITKAVFDRGGFAYAGRVRAFAEGAREGGLQF